MARPHERTYNDADAVRTYDDAGNIRTYIDTGRVWAFAPARKV